MASWVATAYTIRYGKLNADVGPAGVPLDVGASPSGFGDAAVSGEGDGAVVRGGGSIDECEVGALDGIAGSGSARISSSVDAVSMVICLVGGRAWRNV
jgi:hypothetical protein